MGRNKVATWYPYLVVFIAGAVFLSLGMYLGEVRILKMLQRGQVGITCNNNGKVSH